MPGLIHVVDDDASFRTAIERRLRLAGYDVAAYASAQQLLDQLPAVERPECILLDVQIPGLSGPELQSRLIELGSTVPIVFLTGHADTATTVRAIKAGAEDFLAKPVSSEQLIDAIERALAHQETARGQRSRLEALDIAQCFEQPVDHCAEIADKRGRSIVVRRVGEIGVDVDDIANLGVADA